MSAAAGTKTEKSLRSGMICRLFLIPMIEIAMATAATAVRFIQFGPIVCVRTGNRGAIYICITYLHTVSKKRGGGCGFS